MRTDILKEMKKKEENGICKSNGHWVRYNPDEKNFDIAKVMGSNIVSHESKREGSIEKVCDM